VVELAGAGELEWSGRRLDAFRTNESTVRQLAGQLRRRRSGEVKSELASMPSRDAVESLRRRLVNAADSELVMALDRADDARCRLARWLQGVD
jgi:hypothetical protein